MPLMMSIFSWLISRSASLIATSGLLWESALTGTTLYLPPMAPCPGAQVFRPGRSSSTSAVGQTPFRSAKPATLLRNLLMAIEARDPVQSSLREGFGQRALGRRVAVSGARKDRHRRNPVRQIV